jgi:hypothetical protein
MADVDIHRYRRFYLTVLAIVVPGLLGAGAVNIAVDPYGVMNSPMIARVNQLKPQQFSNVRLFKAADVIRLSPDTLVMGSSRTDLGLDPKHPALDHGQQAYNLGLVGPNMYEVKRYLDHAIANQPQLKTVVIGLDFFMFNAYKVDEGDFVDSRLGKRHLRLQDALNITLSIDALNSSYRTVSASFQSDAYYLYRDDGMRYVFRNSNESMRSRFKQSMQGYLETDAYYGSYRLSEEQLSYLQEVVELGQKHDIEMAFFISPAHAAHWEILAKAGLWPEFETWKRRIAEITPIWDFSGYNSITTEAISDDMQNYWDSSHYHESVGNLILNRVLSYDEEAVPTDFGVWLTPATVDAHLTNVREARKAWQAENPELMNWIDDISR